MKIFAVTCAFIALLFATRPTSGADEQLPDWAHPTPGPVQMQAPPDDGQPHHVPGSSVTYTEKQIENPRISKDWYPDEHPPMPPAVAGSENAKEVACASCHLPNGMGHPESAAIAGLPSKYIVAEVAAMATGTRQSIGAMSRVAKAFSPEEVQQAAAYFAALRPVPSVTVVETASVPSTHVVAGSMRLALPDASPEPLGHRIIELPQNVERILDHDPHSGFVAYVPAGSIAAGRALATSCAACHGAGLHGNAAIPWIAGRSPTYVFRQLWDFKHGLRNGPSDAPMKAITANLRDDQMVAIAAYLGTLKP
jgi:cytochrome c553